MITLLPVPAPARDTWAALSRLPGPGPRRRGFLTEPLAEPETDDAALEPAPAEAGDADGNRVGRCFAHNMGE